MYPKHFQWFVIEEVDAKHKLITCPIVKAIWVVLYTKLGIINKQFYVAFKMGSH